MAYTLGNKCAKNLCKRTVLLQLIIENVVTCFFGTQCRCIRGDMIEVYKILTNKYDSRVNLYLEKQQYSITRGHSLKLANNRYHYDLRKFSFAPRIVNVWNSLPEIVISADTTDTFNRRLDKFWQHQDILYDYNFFIRSS